MRARAAIGLWLVAVVHGGCSASYVDTYAPKDARFGVFCSPTAGATGPGAALLVKVDFSGGERQYALACKHREAFVAHLQTVEDYWCDELDVPPRAFGDLLVATTESEITKKRGATLDQGEGYVAFNCGDWLGHLIERVKVTRCCGATP